MSRWRICLSLAAEFDSVMCVGVAKITCVCCFFLGWRRCVFQPWFAQGRGRLLWEVWGVVHLKRCHSPWVGCGL